MLFPQHPETVDCTFVVYADFESILKPVNEDVDITQDVDADSESSSQLFPRAYPMQFCI